MNTGQHFVIMLNYGPNNGLNNSTYITKYYQYLVTDLVFYKKQLVTLVKQPSTKINRLD